MATLNEFEGFNRHGKPKGWLPSEVVLHIEPTPFASGSFRNAHRAVLVQAGKPDTAVVAKFARADVVGDASPDLQVDMYAADVSVQAYTRTWAERFNKKSAKHISVLEAWMVELNERAADGSAVWCALEPYKEGDYIKFNNNDGYVLWDETIRGNHRAQAFSHWSWEASKGTVLFCDLQGVGHYLTDPAVHTKDHGMLPCGTNRNDEGMARFFQTHRCNHICKGLGLPAITVGSGASASSSSRSAVSVTGSHHPGGSGSVRPPISSSRLRADGSAVAGAPRAPRTPAARSVHHGSRRSPYTGVVVSDYCI